MNEHTEVSRLATTDIPKLILAVICSVASKLLSQENDIMAKVTEEVLRNYREFDVERTIDNEKDTTASSTLLFDKNVATDSSLSPADKAVYSVLRILADNEALECSPKVRTIAIKASCSQRVVYRSLNTLEAIGAIKRTPRFRKHRQISSLYKIIGYKPACNSDTSIDHSEGIVAETKRLTDDTDYHSRTIADKGCPANESIACQGITETDWQTVVSMPDCQTENTFRIFKDSKRGASLPTSVGKNLNESDTTNSEAPIEEQKDSLTGGAPLPTSYPKIPEEIMRRYEENRRKYREMYETPKTPVTKAKSEYDAYVDTVINKTIPPQGTFEFLVWKSQNIRKNYEKEFGQPQEPQSVASLLGGVMDNILKPKTSRCEASGEATTPENSSTQEHKTPVIKTETVNMSNPTMTSEKPSKTPAPKIVSTKPDDILAPNTANSSGEPLAPKTKSNPSIKPAIHSEPKKPDKDKSSSVGNPKDIYSPDYAPEVMRPTAEYLLLKTGRKGLRWEEISILRELSAIHYPTVVNKEITRACERFEKRKEPLECLTLMYVAVGLRKWRSFGKKKKKEVSPELKQYMPEEKKDYTAEEKAAAWARLKALEATLDPDD